MYDLTQDHPKILAALSAGFERFHETFDEYGLDESIDAISAASYDGFIAHTNGGLRCMVMSDLRNAESTGLGADTFETNILQPYIDRSNVDAAEEFIRQCEEDHPEYETLCEAWENNNNELSAYDFLYQYWHEIEKEYMAFHDKQLLLPGLEAPAWHMSDTGVKAESEREEFYEVCDAWLTEGAEFWYEARAIFFDTDNRRNKSGKPELFILAGINTDFTYGREKGLDSSFERSIPLDRLTPKRIEVVIDAMIESITASTIAKAA